jgi:hypothetical protein
MGPVRSRFSSAILACAASGAPARLMPTHATSTFRSAQSTVTTQRSTQIFRTATFAHLLWSVPTSALRYGCRSRKARGAMFRISIRKQPSYRNSKFSPDQLTVLLVHS